MSASRYSKSDVLEAALKLLDEFGLPDLTMRKLAASLDLQPSALYWHYPSKQALLAEVSDKVVAFMKPVSTAATWQETAKLEALALRDALLAFRDGAEVVSSTLALGLGAQAAHRRIENAIEVADSQLANSAAESIVFLVLGNVWHQQQRMQANSLGVVDNISFDEVSSLETGIDLILSGLSQKVKA